ncbi:MAG TPA: helix-turn-helix domain-containing protein [Candidatus Baltobacteraceae bacterium]|nr:helix-turn-helix domain-containing protein [Candidatus Baltobacteraceae bacterium]
MKLGDKLRSLRSVEGILRGLDRPMTQVEVAKAMKREIGHSLSQAYLSQIENGVRPHITHTTRELLARFFRVYPGFLVNDPEGYSADLQSDLRALDAKVDSWLFAGAEQFSSDKDLRRALLDVAHHHDSRQLILLLGEIVRTPGLAERLGEVLHPESAGDDEVTGRRQEPLDASARS